MEGGWVKVLGYGRWVLGMAWVMGGGCQVPPGAAVAEGGDAGARPSDAGGGFPAAEAGTAFADAASFLDASGTSLSDAATPPDAGSFDAAAMFALCSGTPCDSVHDCEEGEYCFQSKEAACEGGPTCVSPCNLQACGGDGTDTCPAGTACGALRGLPYCNLRCVPLCDGWEYGTPPEDLLCCTGDDVSPPVCHQGEWRCGEEAATFSTEPAPEQSCGPSRNLAETGVPCDSPTVCAVNCCRSFSTFCAEGQDSSCYAAQWCDGPEDCPNGTVCCASRGYGIYYESACTAPEECSEPSQLGR
jgi:hypothetical protein